MGTPPPQASGCTGTPSRDEGGEGCAPGSTCPGVGGGVQRGGGTPAGRSESESEVAGGAAAAVALEGAAPRLCHVVRGGQPSCYKHKQRGAAAAGAPAPASPPPPLPPLPPPSRPRRAPPARHRQHRARVANARGDREPRAPGKLCEHRSRPAPDASGGRPGAFAGRSRGRGARGPSSPCPALARPPSGAPARPPSSLPLPSGSGSGGCVCVGGKALLPLCSSGGRGDGGRPHARPAHLAPLPEGHAVLPARAFPHPTVFGP